jgi:transposase InsO family protein
LKLEKELVCAPCMHAKMVASSHPLLIDVMTERPCELLHMDLVGPARVRSAGGKWYVLVVVDDYSRHAWVFFLEDKGETFGFVRDLVLRLRNERHGDAIRAIHGDNGSEFRKTLILKPFAMTWVLNISFRVRICLPRMVLWKGRTEHCVRWLRRCLMCIGLREGSGLRR